MLWLDLLLDDTVRGLKTAIEIHQNLIAQGMNNSIGITYVHMSESESERERERER
jgi:hypothetical protein